MLEYLFLVALLCHLVQQGSCSIDGAKKSSWFGSLFGSDSSGSNALSSTSADVVMDANMGSEMPRKEMETIEKWKITDKVHPELSDSIKSGSATDYDSSDPYLDDNDLRLYEQKRAENARMLVEQDMLRDENDREGASGGQKRRRFWPSGLPDVNLRMDPVINFKMKQRISYFGTCVTLGVDYLSDLAQWRAYCGVEDTKLQGRFSLRGSELSWAKSWLVNLGMGEESTAKFKLRLGMNLQTYKAYARLRFRAEPISFFDIGEGLSCAGKLPVPKLPALGTLPLRVEYRLRINTPQQAARSNARRARTASGEDSASENSGENSRNGARRRGKDSDDQVVSLSTGIDSVEVSLDELNFCLEWDEKSPVWGIGLVRTGDRLRGALSAAKPVSAKSMAPNRRKDTDESKIPFSFGKKDKKEKEKDASTPRSAPSTASQPSIHSGIFMDNGLMD